MARAGGRLLGLPTRDGVECDYVDVCPDRSYYTAAAC